MPLSVLFATLLILTLIGYVLGRKRAVTVAQGRVSSLHSVPGYYGFYVALWAGLPALCIFFAWGLFGGAIVDALVRAGLPDTLTQGLSEQELSLVMVDIRNVANGISARETEPAIREAAAHYQHLRMVGSWALAVVALAAACLGLVWSRNRVTPGLRARNRVERTINILLILCSLVAILTTLGIVLSLLFEATRFFARVSPAEFLFGVKWSPQTAIRADQIAAEGAFGAVPLFVGTLLISVIAMLVAVPVGLMSAIYMSEYAPPRFRATVKPLLEILAGIPTVVYGFFAALTMAPFVRDAGQALGLSVSSESALAAGIVMGVMIIPFVSSLSDDVINAVPQALRDGSYGLGATRSETIRQVVLQIGRAHV